ncbi:MAG: hypothetical protein COA32_09425 [Fluviicola sp.]|nr:MAG: hypothetical protein COA32_09425 [Fluviicola sp.]
MKIEANNVDEYIQNAPEERHEVLTHLRDVILKNLPKGFKEELNYGMPGYIVPHSIYSAGYHCNPKLPLPFMNFASQKNFIAFYHMGIYADAELLGWFQKEYKKEVPTKLDMGKSCIRFKNVNNIPFDLIGQLVSKMSVEDWINLYEKQIKR